MGGATGSRWARSSTAVAVVVVLASLCPVRGARAAEPQAELVRAVNKAVERGDYSAAAELLERAYAQDPQPTFLYSKGEALLAAGDCPGALQAFDRFLATDPPRIDAEAARERRATCPQPPPPTVAAPRPVVEPPPTSPPSPRSPPQPRPMARDPLFWGLAGAGGILALGGAGLLVGAKVSADATSSAATEGAWEVQINRSRGLATAGVVTLAAGGALLIGAVLRAVTVNRARRSRD